jgi:two-component system, OmpR family, KDP operon response regulator KdpE
MSGARVLVIDDEPQIQRAIRTALAGHGYGVIGAETGEEGLTRFAERRPDIVLLDLMLPGIDGLEVCRRIREVSSTPIIVLSARGEERDKVAALDLGADDYLTKPFGVEELLARIRVALRHAAGAALEPVVVIGGLTVDLGRRLVTRDGTEIHLTPTEYDVLKYLAQHADRVITHRTLLSAVWGAEYSDQTPMLRVFIKQLRRKVEADPADPRLIVTEPGVGYRLRRDGGAG